MTPSAGHRAAAVTLLLGTAALATACGSATPSAGGQASSPPASPSAAPTTPSTPAATSPPASPSAAAGPAGAVAGCPSAGLTVTVKVSQAGGAAGSIYYPLDFTNTSGHTCTLYGYPGVSFVSGPGGSQLGRPASRNPQAGPATITLAPGGVAHATVQVAEAGNYSPSACQPVTAHWLKIYPPNQTAPLYARFTTQACAAKLPHGASQLSVFVMQPGPGKRGQAP